jgi:hypothetical protein
MTRGFGRFLRRNTIALLALFIALGGTTYAATALPANSVGAKQLKKNAVINKKIKANAVTGAKVKNNSLTGADVLESSLGKVPSATNADHATTANSATNATNATNATSASHAANADKLGGLAASSYDPGAVLPAGKTMKGSWGGYNTASGAGAGFFTVTSFPRPIPANLDAAHAIYVAGASATHCPGAGQAEAGYLCVYQGVISNATTTGAQLVTGGPGASVNGFVVLISPVAAGSSYITGTYAVTAPSGASASTNGGANPGSSCGTPNTRNRFVGPC